MEIVLVIGFIETLPNVTTSNYDSLTELHSPEITVTTAHMKFSQFARSSVVVAWRLISTMFSATMVTFLPTGDCLTTNSLLELSTLKVTVSYFTTGGIRQSVHLSAKPLEDHDQRFFQLNPYGHSPYVISSLMRWYVCLLWMCLSICQMHLSHIPFFTIYTSPLSVQALQSMS
jgi:hypothetical protein